MDEQQQLAPSASEAGSAVTKSLHEPTQRERLVDLRRALTQKISEIDEAIAALDQNPGVEQVMNLLQRVSNGSKRLGLL